MYTDNHNFHTNFELIANIAIEIPWFPNCICTFISKSDLSIYMYVYIYCFHFTSINIHCSRVRRMSGKSYTNNNFPPKHFHHKTVRNWFNRKFILFFLNKYLIDWQCTNDIIPPVSHVIIQLFYCTIKVVRIFFSFFFFFGTYPNDQAK